MKVLKYSILLLLFSFSKSVKAQFPENDRTKVMDLTVQVDPIDVGKNGFILSVPFKYCIINCFGEIYLWISQVPDKIEGYGQYRYKHRDRTYVVDIRGFVKGFDPKSYKYNPYIDLDVSISFGNRSSNVAKVWAYNVISWDFGGCLGQTYSLVPDGKTTTDYGYTNQQLKEYLKELIIRDYKIREVICQDDDIEQAIRLKLEREEKERQETEIDSFYNKFISEANQLLLQKEYTKAKARFSQASDLKNYEEYPKLKIREINNILDRLKTETDFKRYLEDGDSFVKSNQKIDARKSYKAALALFPESRIAQLKLQSLGKDNVEDALSWVKIRTDGLKLRDGGFTQYVCKLMLGSAAGNYFRTEEIPVRSIQTKFDYENDIITIKGLDYTNQFKLSEIEGITIIGNLQKVEHTWLSPPCDLCDCSNNKIVGSVTPVEYAGICINCDDVRKIFISKISDAEKIANLIKEAAISRGAKPFDVYYPSHFKPGLY